MGLSVIVSRSVPLHHPVGANPALVDVLWCLLCPQRPGDVPAIVDPLIIATKRSCAFPGTGYRSDDLMSSGCFLPSAGSRLPAPRGVDKRARGVERNSF